MSRNILPPVKCITTPSSSNPNKVYETLVYQDGSVSCNCPGWTRRVAPDGSRSCKHTVKVISVWLTGVTRPPGVTRAPVAAPTAVRKAQPFTKPPVAAPPVKPTKPAADERIKRRFAFE